VRILKHPESFAAFGKETLTSKERSMAQRKRHSPEQAMELLRKIEDGIANGKTITESCVEAKIAATTYLRLRNERSDAADDQAQRLRELEQENANLKRLVSELCLHKLALRDIIASGGL